MTMTYTITKTITITKTLTITKTITMTITMTIQRQRENTIILILQMAAEYLQVKTEMAELRNYKVFHVPQINFEIHIMCIFPVI